MDRYVKVDDVMGLINTSNRGNCDYFIVDQIEELCVSKKTITDAEIRAKAIEKFAEALRQECLKSPYKEVWLHTMLKIASELKGE